LQHDTNGLYGADRRSLSEHLCCDLHGAQWWQEQTHSHRKALGFAHTATELEEAVALLDADGLLTRAVALSVVAPALARCSLAYGPALVDLARRENPGARLAALVGAARSEPETREHFVDQVMRSLMAHGALTREEHEQLAYLVHITTH
jgi:hypothetical protein